MEVPNLYFEPKGQEPNKSFGTCPSLLKRGDLMFKIGFVKFHVLATACYFGSSENETDHFLCLLDSMWQMKMEIIFSNSLALLLN